MNFYSVCNPAKKPPRMPRIRHPVKHELRPICIGRCLPEGYSRWAEGPFTRSKKLDSWWRFNHFGDLVFEIGIWTSCMACMLYVFFLIYFWTVLYIYNTIKYAWQKKLYLKFTFINKNMYTRTPLTLFQKFSSLLRPQDFLWKKTMMEPVTGGLSPGARYMQPEWLCPKVGGCLGLVIPLDGRRLEA